MWTWACECLFWGIEDVECSSKCETILAIPRNTNECVFSIVVRFGTFWDGECFVESENNLA